MPEPPRTYTYAQLAQRIAEELRVKPSPSALRAARAEDQRALGTRPRSRPRITTAMPPPLEASGPTAPARFDADAIETWLAAHPWRAHARHLATYRATLATTAPAEDAVAQALADGLSWTAISQGLREVRGDSRGVPGIWKALRHLGPITTR